MVTSELESSEPDRKRPRIDEPASSDSPPNFTDHPTLYFGDGNVILRCQKTYFRVHRTLLTKNSPVFRDILVERDRVGGDYFRGCILLSLDDDVDDMEQLLNRVYDGLYVIAVPHKSEYKLTFFSDINVSELTTSTFPALASILRLISKYQIERPRKAIFDLFRREWPSSLETYDAKMASQRVMMLAAGATPENFTVIHPATVIALLREYGYLSADLLAPLFYDLSTHMWQFATPISAHHLTGLALSDIQRFIVGVNKLRALHVREAQCPIGVVTHNACHTALTVGWCGGAHNILHFQGNDMCHPLESWAALISRTKMPPKIEAPATRVVPNEQLGLAAPPPPYNAPIGGGGDPPYWSANRNLGHGVQPAVVRRALLAAAPQHDHHMPAAQVYNAQAQAYHGFVQAYFGHPPVAPPPPMPMAYHQPQGPGPAPRVAQPPQVQPQSQLLKPLFENLCDSCRQSVVLSLEASRRRIWDSLPKLFDLV